MDSGRSLAGPRSRIAANSDLILANPLCCCLASGQCMKFDQLKRREFITLIGGVAANWPFTAHAQQALVIGYLDPTSPGGFAEPHHRGFLQGLKETGYVEGENVAISYRFAENQ